MVKRWITVCCSLFCILLLSACSSTPTLKLNRTSGSTSGEAENFGMRFILKGDAPQGYQVVVTVEKYQNGLMEIVHENPVDTENIKKHFITFGINTSDTNKTGVKIGTSDIIFTIEDEAFHGSCFAGHLLERDLQLHPGESTTIAYWYGGPVDELVEIDKKEEGFQTMIKQQELAYLLKVDTKAKD